MAGDPLTNMLNLSDGYRTAKPVPEFPKRELPNYIRYTIVSGVLVSLTILPYIAIRLSSLHHKLGDIHATNNGLRRELKAVLLEADTRKEEHAKVLQLLGNARNELNEMRVAAEKQNARMVASEAMMKGDIRVLLQEKQKFREQLGPPQEMSEVLATIAAFMQEIEIQLGLPIGKKEDGRGYERIRRYAQGFHQVFRSSEKNTSETVEKTEDTIPLPNKATGNTNDRR